ncbi:MAG: hypothetical protein V4619_00215 [Bacteroidota bacterium]
MLKASALYIVIIIALVIGLLCSSLIVVAYFYRLQDQYTLRQANLQNNLNSGINILTVAPIADYFIEKTFSLYGQDNDSVKLKVTPWGAYDIGLAKSFIQKDSLHASFILANPIDSSKWAALYIIDEDRPISISGKTAIRGDAYIPKAGVKEAYIDNKAYQGSKKLVSGNIRNSGRSLPLLNKERLNQIGQYFDISPRSVKLFKDSASASFFNETEIVQIDKNAAILSNTVLSGNIIVRCDTTLIIENTAHLENVIVVAKAIVVKSGFNGTCQLFAADSIAVESNCKLNYPSVLGVVRMKSSNNRPIAKLNVGENSVISGMLFNYEEGADRNKQPYIGLQRKVAIKGQIYSQGILELKSDVVITGSVFTSRFFYRSSFATYENYIIDATLDANGLSKYYVHSDLVPVVSKKKRVLQWLEKN